jgi:D-arabinose 1-dehydrogenase-like Zn-dependent alcohol dehydrogenase
VVAPTLSVVPIPDSLNFAEAEPFMCVDLTVFNGVRNAGFKPGDRVAVIGLGPLWDTWACSTRKRRLAASRSSAGSRDKEAEVKESWGPNDL